MLIHQTAITAGQRQELSGLLDACRLYEPITLGLPEDADQYFILYGPEPEGVSAAPALLSCLIVCQVQDELWECYAFTRPACRRQGYFSRLLQKLCSIAEEQESLLGIEIDIAFLSDGNSEDGLAAAKALEMTFWYSECQMELELATWRKTQTPEASTLHPLRLDCQPIHEDSDNADGWLYRAFPCSPGMLPTPKACPPSCIGTCRLLPYGHARFYLYHVEIQEGLRSRGWGTSLLHAVLQKLPPDAVVILQVASSNEPALRLYKKAGFRVTETLSYYLY